MNSERLSVVLTVLLVTASSATYSQQPATELKPAARAHLEAARLAAAYDFPAPLSYCENIVPGQRQFNWMGVGAIRQQGGPWGAEPEPAKVFDNLYYLGVRTSTTWAVDTPEGIVLFDSLNNEAEVKTHIENGLRKFSLDPARIKFVVMTHGHGDHYGGSKYLQEKYKARVLMGGPDWDLVARADPVSTPERGAPPTRDMTVTEGQKLPGGITLHLVPGHTLGTVDAISPVTDNGRKHVVALHGGSGFNGFNGDPARYRQYADSNDRFIKIAEAAGADVPLSDHAENDLAIVKVDKLLKRKPGDPHPFVMGPDAVRRLFVAFAECARAWEVQVTK